MRHWHGSVILIIYCQDGALHAMLLRTFTPLMAEETKYDLFFICSFNIITYGIILGGNSPQIINVFKIKK